MSAKKYTILALEDTKSLRTILEYQLKTKGYEVITGENGLEGLKELERNKIDLIISDVMMPEMDGFEFCQKVKEHKFYSKIPFIMLTAKASFDAKLEGLKYGADKYIFKPFQIQELQDSIEDLLVKKSKFQLKVKGENWIEFNIQNSSKYVDEVSEIIKSICWENESFISEVDAVIFSLNTIKNELINPIKDNMNLTLSYAYNKERFVIKVEGFEKDYLKDKLKILKELKQFVDAIKVNTDLNKLLITKKVTQEVTSITPIEQELISIDKTIKSLDNHIDEMHGKVTTTDDIQKKEAKAAQVEQPDKDETIKEKEISKDEKEKEKGIEEPVDAKFEFKNEKDKVVFKFNPAEHGGKRITLNDIKEYCKKNHIVDVSFQMIKRGIEENNEYENEVGPAKYVKDMDGWVEIEISEDLLKAYMKILPPQHVNMKKVTLNYALAVIELYEFDAPNETKLKVAFARNELEDKILIAEGKPPSKGEDAEIKYNLFEGLKARDERIEVERGQLLLYRTMPMIGDKAGLDIHGQIIRPQLGQDITIETNEYITKDKKGMRFFAAVKGKARYKNGKLELRPDDLEDKKYSFSSTNKFVILNNILETESSGSEMLNVKENNVMSCFVKKNDDKELRLIESIKIFEGPKIEDIKKEALEYFNINNESLIDLKVTEKGRKGIMGVGQKDYVVKVSLKFDKLGKNNISALISEISKQKKVLNRLEKKHIGLKDLFDKTAEKGIKEKFKKEMDEVSKAIKEITDKVNIFKTEIQKLINE